MREPTNTPSPPLLALIFNPGREGGAHKWHHSHFHVLGPNPQNSESRIRTEEICKPKSPRPKAPPRSSAKASVCHPQSRTRSPRFSLTWLLTFLQETRIDHCLTRGILQVAVDTSWGRGTDPWCSHSLGPSAQKGRLVPCLASLT